MPDYREMYQKLFNSITNAIATLQKAQEDTEALYINSKVIILELIKLDAIEEDNTENKGGNHA